jgi:hypothetical protein
MTSAKNTTIRTVMLEEIRRIENRREDPRGDASGVSSLA